MRLVDVLTRLLAAKQPVLRTRDAAALLGVEPAHASQLLRRLADAGHLVSLARARWAFPEKVDRAVLPSHLAAPFPAYISLQSALHYHGMISQVPAITYAVSLARTRRFETPLGTVSLHHIDPSFFFGFEPVGKNAIAMATPEKALLDVLYLSPAKTRLFFALPEIEWPYGFKIARARKMIRRIPYAKRRVLVDRLFSDYLKTSGLK